MAYKASYEAKYASDWYRIGADESKQARLNARDTEAHSERFYA